MLQGLRKTSEFKADVEGHLGRTLPRVELWTEEGTGAFNSWNDTLELGRRKDGSFSMRLRRRGIEENYVCTLYRSRPFRTAQRLLDELQHSVATAREEQFCQEFTLSDIFNILAELIDFEPALVRDALRILAQQRRDHGTDKLNPRWHRP